MFYIALHGVIFKIAFKIVYFVVYSIIICLIKGRLYCVGQRLEWVVDTEKCPCIIVMHALTIKMIWKWHRDNYHWPCTFINLRGGKICSGHFVKSFSMVKLSVWLCSIMGTRGKFTQLHFQDQETQNNKIVTPKIILILIYISYNNVIIMCVAVREFYMGHQHVDWKRFT